MTSSEQRATAAVATEHPERAVAALAPAVGAIPGEATVTVTKDGDSVVIEVAAPDLSALRAGTNSWTGLTDVALDAARAVRRHRA